MWEVAFFVVCAVVVPVLINKSTEDKRFDWLKPRLRELWAGLFVFFSVYFLQKQDAMEIFMKWHINLPGWRGYALSAFCGAIVLCAYWWFTGKIVAPAAQEVFKGAVENQSKITGRIDYITADEMPLIYHRRGAGVLVGASIVNTGPPSVAGAWRLKVQMLNAEPFVLEPEVIPGQFTLTPSSGQKVIIDRSEALYEKTAQEPIQTGGREAGILWFLAPNVELAEMRRPGTKYSLMFVDSYSKNGEFEFIVPAVAADRYPYIPGGMPKPDDSAAIAHDESRKLGQPQLRGEILQIGLGDDVPHGYTLATVWLRIYNTGAPSIVEHYHLTFSQGPPLVGSPIAVPKNMDFKGTGQQISDADKSSLVEKTTDDPIQTGGSKTGILMFKFPLGDRVTISQNFNSAKLTFMDIKGTTYEAVKNLDGGGPVPRYYPGGPKFSPESPPKQQ